MVQSCRLCREQEASRVCNSEILRLFLMLKYFIAAAFLFSALVRSSELEPSGDAFECPGEQVSFVCTVNTLDIMWIWKWENGTVGGQQIYANTKQINMTTNLSKPGVPGVTTTLLYIGPNNTYLRSSLQFTIVKEFNGSTISCGDQHRQVVLEAQPSSQPKLNISLSCCHMNTSAIRLEWYMDGHATNYTVDYSSSEDDQQTNTTNNTSILLELLYNISYTLSLTANNCIGSSNSVTHNVTVMEREDQQFNGTSSCHFQPHFMAVETSSASAINDDIVLQCDTSTSATATMTTTVINNTSQNLSMNLSSTELNSPAVSQNLLPWEFIAAGSIAGVTVVLISISILIPVIIIIKRKKGGKMNISNLSSLNEDTTCQNESEHDRVNFHRILDRQQNETSVYGRPNHPETSQIVDQSRVPVSSEEYATIGASNPQGAATARVKPLPSQYSILGQEHGNQQSSKTPATQDADLSTSCDDPTVATIAMDMTMVKYSMVNLQKREVDQLLNLDTLLIQLHDVASQWKQLGEALFYKPDEIEVFGEKGEGNDFNCLVELCDSWLKKTDRPTWKRIAYALSKIQYNDLSETTLNIYTTGQLPGHSSSSNAQEMSAYDDVIVIASTEGTPPPVPPQLF